MRRAGGRSAAAAAGGADLLGLLLELLGLDGRLVGVDQAQALLLVAPQALDVRVKLVADGHELGCGQQLAGGLTWRRLRRAHDLVARVIGRLALELRDLAHQLAAVLPILYGIAGTLAVRPAHERAATVLGAEQPPLLETPVDRPDGVHVHARERRHRADAGQLVAGAQLPGSDRLLQLPGELHPQRDTAPTVERKVCGQSHTHQWYTLHTAFPARG